MSPALFVAEMWAALQGAPERLDRLRIVGAGHLASAYRVTDLAAASVGVAALAALELDRATDAAAEVVVDRATASAWYASAVEPVGWDIPSPWDPLSGTYRAADGWIRLHTNAPYHRTAALAVLDAADHGVPAAVARWNAIPLQEAIVAAGGCAAAMMTRDQWRRHPQGVAVAAEPLVDWSAEETTRASGPTWVPDRHRPLAGLRVLDLTRVIAGPVASRFLAGLGADVLRIDPPGWDEDALVPEMTLGKRTARLDASTESGLALLKSLISGADVLVHGYRMGALDRLGLDRRRFRRPDLVEVSLDAYGFTGPWANRRGFDSIVQVSCGIAAGGADWAGADSPTPLPVQALDHSAGYLLAAAALRGLAVLHRTGRGVTARTSLARVAELLVSAGGADEASAKQVPVGTVRARLPLETPWGSALLLPPPATINSVRFGFDRGPSPLGADTATWESGVAGPGGFRARS